MSAEVILYFLYARVLVAQSGAVLLKSMAIVTHAAERPGIPPYSIGRGGHRLGYGCVATSSWLG